MRQYCAFPSPNVDAPVGLTEHVSDGGIQEPYPTRTVVIAGNSPFTATRTGALPTGMNFDLVFGELSGTPTEAGAFTFTVEAQAGTDPVARRTYTLTIAEAGVALPARGTVDTSSSPHDSGSTAGDGSYPVGATAVVNAEPGVGFAFAGWTDNGRLVSLSARFEFTTLVNRSLVATFVPGPPALSFSLPQAGTLILNWPTNATGLVLQSNSELRPTDWVNATEVPAVVGPNQQVTLSPLPGMRFFRLMRP